MITPIVELGTAPLFRREVELDAGHGAVTSAALHISSLGVFEASLNGTPVGDDVLSPGWTPYEWRLRYRSYDVTDLLEATTVLAASVGQRVVPRPPRLPGRRAIYGDELGLIAQLEIDFADGHRQVVGTDETWRAGGSDVLADDLYDGQTIDARRRSDAWLRPADPAATGRSGPSGFTPVRTWTSTPTASRRTSARRSTRQEVLRPVRIWTSPSGRTLVDFGQNLVGWLRFTVRGPRGSEIRIRHAEVLEHDELGTRPLRDAQATDRFILSGGEDFFEPTMTFHGFRYAEVTGWPGELTADDLEAVVVHSDLRRTGPFECSDRDAQPAAPQRRLGHQGQLPRRAHRLPAARRAARLDR